MRFSIKLFNFLIQTVVFLNWTKLFSKINAELIWFFQIFKILKKKKNKKGIIWSLFCYFWFLRFVLRLNDFSIGKSKINGRAFSNFEVCSGWSLRWKIIKSPNKNAHARIHSKILWFILGWVCIQKFVGLREMACRIPNIMPI